MAGLEGFREKYPQYSDMPDQVLADRLHAKHYSDIPKDQYYKSLGIAMDADPAARTDATPDELAEAERPAQAIRLKGGRQVALVRPEMTRDNWDKSTQGEARAPWTGENSVVGNMAGGMVAGGRSAAANLRRAVAEESAASRRATLGVRAPTPEEIDDFDMRGEPVPKEIQVFDPAQSGQTDGGAVTGRVLPGALDRQRELLGKDEAAIKAAERDASIARTDLLAVTPPNMDTAQQAVWSLAQSAPPTLAGVAVGILTRNPALAMAIAGGGGSAFQAGSTYGEAREKGASHRMSATAATIDGILEGVGEALPLAIALKHGSPVANRIFGTIVAEAGQEAATQIMQDLNAFLTYNPKITLKEAWQNLKVATLSGAMGGAVYGTAGAAADASRQKAMIRDDVATDLKTDTGIPHGTPPAQATPQAGLEAGLEGTPADSAPLTPMTPEPGDGSAAEAVPEGEQTAMQLAMRRAQEKAGVAPDVTDVEALPGNAGTKAAPVVATTEADIAAAEAKVNTAPSDAQKEAGNYAKGHLKMQGLDITIENPMGSTRSGTTPEGETWETTLPAAYGYVKRTEGADGDQVDVYVGPDPKSRQVYIVDQIDPKTGRFDEHKALIGYSDQSDALSAYDQAFSDGTGESRRGAVTPMGMGDFRKWLKSADTTEPYAYEYRSPQLDALKDAKILATVESMKAAVGAQERGGKLVFDEVGRNTEPGGGEVLGRTSWVGESWWFGRPDQSLSADQARSAIDKAVAGKKLGKRQLDFVEYVVKIAQDVESQFAGIDEKALDEAGYNDLSDAGKAVLDQVVADAVRVLGESTVEDIQERLALQTDNEADYESKLREALAEAVTAAGNRAATGETAESGAGQSAERGQQSTRAPPESAGGVDGQSNQIGAGASDGAQREALRNDNGASQRGDAGARASGDRQAVQLPSKPTDGATAKAVTDKTPSKEGVVSGAPSLELAGETPADLAAKYVDSDGNEIKLKRKLSYGYMVTDATMAVAEDENDVLWYERGSYPARGETLISKVPEKKFSDAWKSMVSKKDSALSPSPATAPDQTEIQKREEKAIADRERDQFALAPPATPEREAGKTAQADIFGGPKPEDLQKPKPQAAPEPGGLFAQKQEPAGLTVSQIPTDAVITLSVKVEETGEVHEVEFNAREAFKDAQRKAKRMQALRDCMA